MVAVFATDPSTRPPLRVGYVNVRGLSEEKWERACSLLGHAFDFLFLAETWFVERGMDTRDRRLICTSTKPAKPIRGRHTGGIYLIGTAAARAMTSPDPVVSEHSVSVTINGMILSGVYFPPSMTVDTMGTILRNLSTSSVIVGDLNTRFRGVRRSGKQPVGPPERLRAFASFQRVYGFRLLEPTLRRPRDVPRRIKLTDCLGVDHCFVARSVLEAEMAAFTTKSVQIDTDHPYAIGVYIGAGETQETQGVEQAPRYAIGRLANELVRKDVHRLFGEEAARPALRMGFDGRVDALDGLLLGMCQRVCERALPKSASVVKRPRHKSHGTLHARQDMDASIRLFKLAKTSSAENGPVRLSTTAVASGQSAMEEITASFEQRFCATQPWKPDWLERHGPEEQTRHEPWTVEEVACEIRGQSGAKSAGGDGIHMLLLKTLLPTALPSLLCRLYNHCLDLGRTPRRWADTEIHLITKDHTKDRDISNLRPITLICMFRKIFERLLLKRSNEAEWTRLHSTQAGFRPHYSTNVNAAIVHYALASGAS